MRVIFNTLGKIHLLLVFHEIKEHFKHSTHNEQTRNCSITPRWEGNGLNYLLLMRNMNHNSMSNGNASAQNRRKSLLCTVWTSRQDRAFNGVGCLQ